MSPYYKGICPKYNDLTQEEVYMATRMQATNVRQSGDLEEKPEDATLYKWGWLMGLTVGALTAVYRYAG